MFRLTSVNNYLYIVAEVALQLCDARVLQRVFFLYFFINSDKMQHAFILKADAVTILQADGVTCVSIVECDSNNNCSELCSRVNGKDVCQCPVGYSLNVDGLNCDDVDECDIGNHVCEEENMVNSEATFDLIR